MIYHITTQADWQRAQVQGFYQPAGFEAGGFIHCSDLGQVLGVANRFYTDLPGLIVLCINPDLSGVPLVYENLEGGEALFPHLYGDLKLEAVLDTFTFARDAERRYLLPPEIILKFSGEVKL